MTNLERSKTLLQRFLLFVCLVCTHYTRNYFLFTTQKQYSFVCTAIKIKICCSTWHLYFWCSVVSSLSF